jgi:hypothetical protein
MIQEARARDDKAGIFAEMPDRDTAAQALDYLTEMSPDMRGGAILDGAGNVLASSGGEEWAEAVAALLEAADAGDGAAEQVHVATEEGEVFSLRHGGFTAVVVTERFVLASLMAFDMRAVLRDLAATGTGTAQAS